MSLHLANLAHFSAPFLLFPAALPGVRRDARIQLVVRMGVGYDNVDCEAAGALGIPVCGNYDMILLLHRLSRVVKMSPLRKPCLSF